MTPRPTAAGSGVLMPGRTAADMDAGRADAGGARPAAHGGLPRRFVVLAALAAAFAGGCASTGGPAASPASAPDGAATAAAPTALPTGPLPIPPTAQVRATAVDIPAIGVRSTLVPLTLDRSGVLVPPADFGTAGWFSGGPTPGEPGPAVLAGHVDSRRGPAVFFRLRELAAGDLVMVSRSDGRKVRFRVDSVSRYPKGAFPTADVYGPAPGAQLRLITCGGSFDTARRSYRDNVVVYASRA